MSFCSLIKGITPKMCLLYFVLINSVILLEYNFMVCMSVCLYDCSVISVVRVCKIVLISYTLIFKSGLFVRLGALEILLIIVTDIHARTHPRTHARTNARTHTRMHAYTHTHTHTHTHIHTHAHSLTHSGQT